VTAALAAGLVAGYGIAVPIGAVGTYLVTLAARHGVRRGVFGALGVASADALYATLAVLGGAALASAVQPLARPLQLVSVAVLLAISLVVATQTVREHAGRRAPAGRGGEADAVEAPGRGATRSDWRAYLTFLGMTVLNPMTVVYFAALVIGGQGELFGSAGDRFVFVLAATAASASWQLVLASGGALLGRALTGPRGRLVTGAVSSAVIAVLALRLV